MMSLNKKQAVLIRFCICLVLSLVSALANAEEVLVLRVATDGSQGFDSVQDAIDSAVQAKQNADQDSISSVRIEIGPGSYHEKIVVPRKAPPMTLVGAGMEKTHLSYHLHARMPKKDQNGKRLSGEIGTSGTASVSIYSNDFVAQDLSLINTTPRDISQALALKADGDRMLFERVHLIGWQDTLYTANGRQYYKNCVIEGGVDFIFGSGAVLFDNCEIRSKRSGYITAARTDQDAGYGYVFLNCRLTRASEDAVADDQVYLGRPWRDYAYVTFVDCWMDSHIKSVGWHDWGKPNRQKTSRYQEVGSVGPGASLGQRVDWVKPIDLDKLEQIRAGLIWETQEGSWRPIVARVSNE